MLLFILLLLLNPLCYYVTHTYYNFWYYIVHLPKIINSCILCIRFPFLYPRNRFTLLHYNNWRLMSFINRRKKTCLINTTVVVYDTDEKHVEEHANKLNSIFENEQTLYIDVKECAVLLKTIENGKEVTFFKFEIPEGYKLHRVFFNDRHALEIYISNIDGLHSFPKIEFYYAKYIIDKKMYKFYCFLDWFYRHPLQWIHAIPIYTEIEGIPKGWRKLSIDMFSEIKKRLIKDGNKKILYKYVITEFKEKWGGIDLLYPPVKCWDIVNKYRILSKNTCSVCGKPATKVSTGYIMPYCDKHADKNCINIKDWNGFE